MTKHLFGWSYPPGAASDPNAPYNQTDDQFSPEGDRAAEILDEMHQGVCELSKGEDTIMAIIESLASDRSHLTALLHATLIFLPARGPEPVCTCKSSKDEYWCERHNGAWEELTLKEEIENILKPKEAK